MTRKLLFSNFKFFKNFDIHQIVLITKKRDYIETFTLYFVTENCYLFLFIVKKSLHRFILQQIRYRKINYIATTKLF